MVTSRVSEHIFREPRDARPGAERRTWSVVLFVRTHGWIYESVICRKTTVNVQNESLYLMFVLSQRSLSAVVIITAEEEEVRRSSRKRGDHC